MIIKLKMFDLGQDRIKEAIAQNLTLNGNHLLYHVECHVEKHPDKDEGEFLVKQEYICYHTMILKLHVTSVTCDFAPWEKDDTFDCWVVEINYCGGYDRLRIKCETQEFAMNLWKQIQEWLLS